MSVGMSKKDRKYVKGLIDEMIKDENFMVLEQDYGLPTHEGWEFTITVKGFVSNKKLKELKK